MQAQFRHNLSAVLFWAAYLAAGPGYGQASFSDSPSKSGLSPYFGKRRVKLPPPPPVNAVVNSSLESDGSQFLLPFQGIVSTEPVPVQKSNTASIGSSAKVVNTPYTAGWLPRLSTIVPTDIDYGDDDTQDGGTVGSRNGTNVANAANGTNAANDTSTANGTSSTTVATVATTTAGDERNSDSQITSPSSWPGRARAGKPKPERVRNSKISLKLFGSVSRDDQFGVRIDDLLACALARNTKMKDIDRSVAHFHCRSSKTFEGAKDSLDDATDYKGFSRSMEAADVILDKNVKAKSAESSDYIKQRYVDQLHPKIVSRVMEIAMGLGLSDKERGKEITNTGIKALSEIVGERQAKNTAAMLRDWTEHINIPPEIFQQQQWDVEAYRNKVNLATKIAMNSDPMVNDIVKQIRKYDRSGVASKAVGATNVAANLAEVAAPGLAIPFAVEMVRVGVVQANGGSEPKKLLRELYYDKRIESRYRTINEESQLAITDYQLAVVHRNPVLLACAESVLSQLVGPECITDLLDTSIFHPAADTPRTENTQILEADRNVVVR